MQDHHFDDLVARARTRRVHDEVDAALESRAADAIERALMVPLSAERAAAILDRVTGPSAKVLSLPAARKSHWIRGLVVAPLLLAAAATVAFVVRAPATSISDDLAVVDSGRYELVVLGARGETRGSEELPTFVASDRVRLRLRPRDVVSETVTSTVRAVQDGRVVPLDWAVQATSSRGHLMIEGDAADIRAIAAGVWDIEVTIHGGRDTPRWRGRSRVRIVSEIELQ